jgi:hypothetical protein
MAAAAPKWPAVIVDEVDEENILRCTAQYLPIRIVLASDLSQIAVLSWRWDGHHEVWGSHNVVSAIRQAKKMGIKYLFIDAISIDQTLRGDKLLQQIVAFSALYKTIPVIAAYDKLGDEFRKTVRRPWILHEARAFKYNPTKIVYVGHNDQGARPAPERERSQGLSWSAPRSKHKKAKAVLSLNAC